MGLSTSIKETLARRSFAAAVLVAAAIVLFGHLVNTTAILVDRSPILETRVGRISRCEKFESTRTPLVDVWLDGDGRTFFRLGTPSTFQPTLQALCADGAQVALTFRSAGHGGASQVNWIEGVERLAGRDRVLLRAQPIDPDSERPSMPLIAACVVAVALAMVRLLIPHRE